MFTGLRGDERGAVAPLTGMLLLVLLGMAALVIDLGWLFVVRGELQNAADAGALAGVVELVYTGEDAAEATAVTYATQSNHFRLTDPAPGADAVTVTPLGPETLQVRVRRATGTGAGAVGTIFARLWGTDTADVEALAVATLNRRITGTGPGNLLPFGIYEPLLDSNNDGNYDVGSTTDIFPHEYSPGNFGLLDLDGGSNSNEDIERWITDGYDGTFTTPESPGYIDVNGDPGLSGDSLSGPVSSRVGDTVLFPVFDQFSGQGSGATFRVIGFVGGTMTSFQLGGSDETNHITIEIGEFSSPNLIVGGAGTPSNNTVSTPVLIQ
ncbi:MAG: pilus assembly protein TadG-related protein [Candidatus Tectimicrobiota bacterium]